MDYDLVAKMQVNELKICLKVCGLKISGNKNELVAGVFSAIENVMPVKTAVELEEDLKKEHEKKLRVDDRLIPEPFKIPHGWLEEDEGMTFWLMLLYPDIFNYLMFYPTQLDSTDLSDYKNSKAYSCYNSDWFQPLYFHKLSGSKLWIIMEKSGKIRSCHFICMAGMGQSCNHVQKQSSRSVHRKRCSENMQKIYRRTSMSKCDFNKVALQLLLHGCSPVKLLHIFTTPFCKNTSGGLVLHVAAAMYRTEAAVRNGLTNPSCTSTKNQWLPNHKNAQPMKVKDINFDREDLRQ